MSDRWLQLYIAQVLLIKIENTKHGGPHLIFRFFENSSMLIFSMRMKSPGPTLVWMAMVAACHLV